MAAFQESQWRVNLEFLRASQSGAGRVIRFNHGPAVIPPQLQGRLAPEVWAAFMADIDTLAKHHPYVQPPTAKHYGKWAACFAVGAVVGLFCVDPDAGSYADWTAEAAGVLAAHQPAFNAHCCTLSLQALRRGEYYVQIDINPDAKPVQAPSPFAQ